MTYFCVHRETHLASTTSALQACPTQSTRQLSMMHLSLCLGMGGMRVKKAQSYTLDMTCAVSCMTSSKALTLAACCRLCKPWFSAFSSDCTAA